MVKFLARDSGRNCLYFYPQSYLEEAQKRGLATVLYLAIAPARRAAQPTAGLNSPTVTPPLAARCMPGGFFFWGPMDISPQLRYTVGRTGKGDFVYAKLPLGHPGLRRYRQ